MNETEKKIRSYLAAAAGTANHPSNHTIDSFIGMIETGESTWEQMELVGGRWLVERIETRWDEIRCKNG